LCPKAVTDVKELHPTTVQRRIERACLQAKAADREVITGDVAENIELDELYGFALPSSRMSKKTIVSRWDSIGHIARWRANRTICWKS
jgi:hypothetical protein